MGYDAFQRFLDPARADGPRFWSAVLALIGLTLVFEVALVLAFMVAPLPGLYWQPILENAAFLGGILALTIVLRSFYRRGLRSVIGDLARAQRDFWRAAGVVLALSAVEMLVWSLLDPEALGVRSFLSFERWALFLPALVVSLVIQTGAEELMFRGFLQQKLALRHGSRFWWMVLPSVVFGLLHWFNATGIDALIYVGFTTALGLAWADLTARTGSLGAAWGAHFGLNLPVMAISAPEGNGDELALFVYAGDAVQSPVISMAYVLAWVALSWALVCWVTAPKMDAGAETD